MAQPPPIDFKKLKLNSVINESTLTKSITFKGTYDGDKDVVVRLEKSPFEATSVKECLADSDLETERSLANDIYFRYKLVSPRVSGLNDIKSIIVLPANDKVLAKYSRSETVLFIETAETYINTVEPYVRNMLNMDKDYNQWIYNILEGRSEVESVILNDPDQNSGFMLMPSLKSSGDEKDLHILAICHKRDIRSLRDLNESHLGLLNNILTKGTKAIRDKYPNHIGQLRSYVHYQPTFYHFHVHFEMIDASEYRASDRDNLLTTVINNIRLIGDYYKLATLTYPISVSSGLHKELKDKGCL